MRPRAYNTHSMTRNFWRISKLKQRFTVKINIIISLAEVSDLRVKIEEWMVRWSHPSTRLPDQSSYKLDRTQHTNGIYHRSGNIQHIIWQPCSQPKQSRICFTSTCHRWINEWVSGDGGSTQLGTSFGRSWRCLPSSSNSTISSVKVNGRSYHGPVFDEKGNILNWLLIWLRLLLSWLGRTVLKFIYYMLNSILKNDIHTPS